MITVILPTRNDRAVGKVIDEIKVLPFEPKIIVTDYKSTDGTREIALSKGVILVDEPLKGKGIAVRNVMEGITEGYVLLLDADYTYPAWYLTEILRELHSGADVVVGVRAIREEGSMSFLNRVGNFLLSLMASTLFEYRVRDVCSGMWGFRAKALEKFDLTSNGFTLEADFFINAIRNGCRITQVPILYRARLDGSKPKLNLWDGFKIGWFIIKRWMR